MISEQPAGATRSDSALDTSLLHVILNPAAGGGSAGRNWPDYQRALSERGYAIGVRVTSGPGDAMTIARELAEGGAETLVCVGGDGTVNEVINGLLVNDLPVQPTLRLAIISCGTGQDLVRTLGTRDLDTTLESLSLGSSALLDVGRMQYIDGYTGHLETRYFINVADAGIGASTAERINASSKRFGGLISYLSAAVQTIVKYQPWEATVDVDGVQVFDGTVGMVVFANGRYFAGGMLVAPDASLCDGRIDLFILEGVGKRRLLTSLLPRVYRGKHVGQAGIMHFAAETATVRSGPELLMEIDGEQVGRAPLTVTTIPRALRVIGHPAALERMTSCTEASV